MNTERISPWNLRGLWLCTGLLMALAPSLAGADTPPAETTAPPDNTLPAEPVICACLPIEDIDPMDAIVYRRPGTRAEA